MEEAKEWYRCENQARGDSVLEEAIRELKEWAE